MAVALAAAIAWQSREQPAEPASLLAVVHARTPASQVRDGIARALDLPGGIAAVEAGAILGNGTHVSAPDTVPFSLWCAAHAGSSYADALASTVSAGGDMDTSCAIVGGIVVMRTGSSSIPPAWRTSRESLEHVLAQARSAP